MNPHSSWKWSLVECDQARALKPNILHIFTFFCNQKKYFSLQKTGKKQNFFTPKNWQKAEFFLDYKKVPPVQKLHAGRSGQWGLLNLQLFAKSHCGNAWPSDFARKFRSPLT
jgi:hypothetical protein